MMCSANYYPVANLSFVKHSLQNDTAYCSDNIMNLNIIMSTVFMSGNIKANIKIGKSGVKRWEFCCWLQWSLDSMM